MSERRIEAGGPKGSAVAGRRTDEVREGTAPRLLRLEQATVSFVSGPLLAVELAEGAGYGELVDVVDGDGEVRHGQVLEIDRGPSAEGTPARWGVCGGGPGVTEVRARAIVQVFAGTRGLDLETTRVRFGGQALHLGVGPDLLGRTFDGFGAPLDGDPPPFPVAFRDVNGRPINPAARDHPADPVATGFSAIDGLNTLVRGQKLPIFSAAGLPADELAARIAGQAAAAGATAGFVVVFAALGITQREAAFYTRFFAEEGSPERTVVFLNRAGDPSIERLLTPRLALTAAEYFAFDEGRDVLAILTDMTNYCEALREVATAREEVPGRRGYPGYMYTDLAGLYERAGRLRGRPGSLTQLVLLSMPDDDLTHPVPDLTGYITEGQVVLSRDLHRRGVFPPIDVLPSLSRLMNAGIGEAKTRPDHRQVADQLYACYARGRDLRRLVAVIGDAALSEEDRRSLDFADEFERRFVGQAAPRTVEETLDLAWELLSGFPPAELQRIRPELIARYGRYRAPAPPARPGP